MNDLNLAKNNMAGTNPEKPLFSILIPSWNNLDILKITVNSILKNSTYNHQVIIHINEGSDGSLDWAKLNNIPHTHSAGNVGVCYGFNLASSLATSTYLVLSDDDNYFCPGWDKYLYEEVQKQTDMKWCISGTLIEREETNNKCVIAPYNFGSSKEDFDEERLLNEFDKIPFGDWQGSNWYPMVLPRQVWCAVGGLSVEFSPGMYSDPDFMMKLWHYGIRTFKGVSKARAYHFMSKTTSRVKRNNGSKTFLFKWGMSSSAFLKYYLNMGRNSGIENPVPFTKKVTDYFKKIWLSITNAE